MRADFETAVVAYEEGDYERAFTEFEKLAELGVARLQWLGTRHGKERVASGSKQFAWVLAATEQSRGAWLMETHPEMVRWRELEDPVVVCHPGGDKGRPLARTVVIGPEGGFAEDEIPDDLARWDADFYDNQLGGGADDSAPRSLVRFHRLPEIRVEQQVLQVFIFIIGLPDIAKETTPNDTATAPHQGNITKTQCPAIFSCSITHQHISLGIRHNFGSIERIMDILDEGLLITRKFHRW